MTTHPIDTDRLRSLSLDVREGGSYLTDEEEWFVAGEVSALLDALAAAEHRATRAEAQAEASIKAVREAAQVIADACDRWEVDGDDERLVNEVLDPWTTRTLPPEEATE